MFPMNDNLMYPNFNIAHGRKENLEYSRYPRDVSFEESKFTRNVPFEDCVYPHDDFKYPNSPIMHEEDAGLDLGQPNICNRNGKSGYSQDIFEFVEKLTAKVRSLNIRPRHSSPPALPRCFYCHKGGHLRYSCAKLANASVKKDTASVGGRDLRRREKSERWEKKPF